MYLWLKALHIVFVVCWFAGLFYMPRILVYHAASDDASVREQLAVMARRLYRFVSPLMVIAIVLGAALFALNPGYYLQSTWFWLKLAGVVALLVYHVVCGNYIKAACDAENEHGHVYYRFFNEIPVLFLFAIVILAVLKPF